MVRSVLFRSLPCHARCLGQRTRHGDQGDPDQLDVRVIDADLDLEELARGKGGWIRRSHRGGVAAIAEAVLGHDRVHRGGHIRGSGSKNYPTPYADSGGVVNLLSLQVGPAVFE